MAWTDNMRAASFRGVPFKVESHDLQGGRRTVTHEFPLRDKPFVEDMGRKAKQFSVDAYVIGDDYMQRRDALMRACDEAGSAELVHPYLGTLKVVCTGWTLRESKSEGRMARFSLSFIESGEAEFPSETRDSIARAFTVADAAKAASIADFARKFSIDGMPDFAISDATSLLNSAASKILGMSNAVTSLTTDKSNLFGMVNVFSGSLASALTAPQSLAASLFTLVETVTGVFDSPLYAARKLMDLFGFGRDVQPVRVTTATRQRQAENRDAIFGLVQQAAVIQAARIAPTATFETGEEAEELRDALADQLDNVMENPATPDETFAAIQSVRTELVRGVPPEAVALPNIMTVTPPITLPALVLAYDIYQDAERDAEIVARNRIVHPGFVPGARPLKMIADA